MTAEVINYFVTLPFWELVAVVSSLAYVIFAAKGSLWCWPAALLSTVLYAVIFYEVYLWSDALLQIYYFVMAIYGWFCWYQQRHIYPNQVNDLPISQYSMSYHGLAILLLSLLSLLLGFVMDNYTPTDFPYLDAATTVFAIFATYLITQTVIENWLYWVVIDAVSIYLYQAKGLTPTAALFVLYVLLAIYGYFSWQKKWQNQHQEPNLLLDEPH